MKSLSLLVMFLVTSTFCSAQEFSLIKEMSKTAPTVTIGSDVPSEPIVPIQETPPAPDVPPVQAPPVQAPPVQAPPVQAPPVQAPPVQAPPVQVGPLKVEVSPVSVLITKDASIRETATGEKAVFIEGDVDKVEKGVKVKLIGNINKPLLRAYKSPVFFPPIILSVYDANSWFFTGTNGEYTIEILDSVNGSWTVEYVNVIIKDGAVGPPVTPPVTDPNDPPVTPPISGDYKAFEELVVKLVRETNDPTVAAALAREYEVAFKKLNSQTLDEMRKIMSEGRRVAFNSVPSRNVKWNTALMQIDSQIPKDINTTEYKKMMSAFVSGFKKGVS